MLRRDTDADRLPISTNCLQSLKDKIKLNLLLAVELLIDVAKLTNVANAYIYIYSCEHLVGKKYAFQIHFL